MTARTGPSRTALSGGVAVAGCSAARLVAVRSGSREWGKYQDALAAYEKADCSGRRPFREYGEAVVLPAIEAGRIKRSSTLRKPCNKGMRKQRVEPRS